MKLKINKGKGVEEIIKEAEAYLEEVFEDMNKAQQAHPDKCLNFGAYWDIIHYPVLRALVALDCKVSTEQVLRDLKHSDGTPWQDYIRNKNKEKIDAERKQ